MFIYRSSILMLELKGGNEEIRTLETFRFASLAVKCLRPLGHVSLFGAPGETRTLKPFGTGF